MHSTHPKLCRLLPLVLLALLACWPAAPVLHAQTSAGGVAGAPTPAPAKKKRFGDSRDRVGLEVFANPSTLRPGDKGVIAVVLDHQKGWHSHTHDPKVPPALGKPDDYIKTELKLAPLAGVVDGAAAGDVHVFMGLIQWPAVHEVMVNFGGEGVKYGVFEGRSVVLVPIAIDPAAAPGEREVGFTLTFQSCDASSCIAPAFNVKLATKIKVEPGAAPAEAFKKEGDFAAFDEAIFAKISEAKPPATAPAASATQQAVPPAASTGEAPLPGNNAVNFAFFGYDFSVDPRGAAGITEMILLAMLGGFLLNFTPCVLPVIPIKMMSLSRAAGDRLKCLWLGSIMSLGVVLFWLVLGGAIAATATLLTSKGAAGGITSANQLFQNPKFTITVGVIIVVMAIGMCGLFAIRLPQFVYNYSPKADSVSGSIGMGIMTAVLSTPCTAPFMGAAAAWAVGAGATLTLTIFSAIGLGMAMPYFLLSAFPAAASRMPRTGPASELIKQVMGLLMLAAGVYFIGSGVSGALVTPPMPPSRAYWWVVMIVVVAAGLWLGWRSFRITRSLGLRLLWCVVSLALIAGAINVARSATEPGPTQWVYYTPDMLKSVQSQGRIVVMDFTAEWCLNCKVLEKNVLDTQRVSSLLNGPNVVPMKVDLTGNNMDGNEMLRAVDSVTIPLLVVFDKQGRIVFKSDAYTADDVADAIKRAGGG